MSETRVDDTALVDQTEGPKLRVETNLNLGIEKFKRRPDDRNELLSSYAQGMAGVTGRKPLPVRITEGEHDILVRKGYLGVGTEYIKRVQEWADSGVEKAEAAVFGTLARMVSKKTGTNTFEKARDAARGALASFLPDDETGNLIADAAANSIGSYASTLENIHKINEEFPGLRGAVAASFIANAQVTHPAPLFESQKDSERWRAAWSTMVMEMLTPEAVSEEMYPDEETREAVQTAARTLMECVDEFGNVDYSKVHDAARTLERVFVHEEEDRDDESGDGEGEGGEGEEGGGEGSGAPDPGMLDASLSSDAESIALPRDDGAETGAAGVQRVIDSEVRVLESVAGGQATESPLTQGLREWLLDVRLEQYPGQQAGRVTPQVHRLMTDGRIFGKRMRVPEAPDACVVVCVDGSGSMGGYHSGYETNMKKATDLHDALVYSLDQLDIEFASCVYCGNDGGQEEVHPVNLPGDPYPKVVNRSARWRQGNGDMAAMLWSTKVIEESRKKMGCVVLLADGQLTTTNTETFRAKAEELNVSVFHVDFINSRVSPFGGGHIKAGGVSMEQIAQPLARGLADALGLE